MEEGNSLQTSNEQVAACQDWQGVLPACAPLANPYVPFQQEGSETYPAPRGMIRGTLFPGLDLPFMGLVNRIEKTAPINELQAMSFALVELGLYLDTHKDDAEALELFNQYRALYGEGLERFQTTYGPLTQANAGAGGTYNWLQNPWPWEYQETGGNG